MKHDTALLKELFEAHLGPIKADIQELKMTAREGVRANQRIDKHESWAAGAFAVVSTIAAGAGFAANYILRKFGYA